jgi:hypothetical protein
MGGVCMKRFAWLLAGISLCSFVSRVGGILVSLPDAPVDRLVANGEAYVRENPNDVHGYYTLGRTHYLAFITKAEEVQAGGGKVEWEMARDWNRRYVDSTIKTNIRHLRIRHAQIFLSQESGYKPFEERSQEERVEYRRREAAKIAELESTGWTPSPPSNGVLADHASNAKKNLQKAIAIDPNNALYHLAMASLIEQYVEFLRATKCDVTPDEFTDIILDGAREEYYAAYDFALTKDLKERRPPEGVENIVSHEAGEGYIRLTDRKSVLSPQEGRKVAAVKQNVKRLKALPPGFITPVIFTPDGSEALTDLVAAGLRVSFDLNGDGQIEKWPWVKPTTGILVWDPDRTGQITSGRQLFGSVTWWLFFADGYHALDALDDNRDGQLTGSELDGIAVWFDRNSDGHSDEGEVIPLAEFGVTAIATKAGGRDGDSLMNPAGITLRNGSTVPSYDWVAVQDRP